MSDSENPNTPINEPVEEQTEETVEDFQIRNDIDNYHQALKRRRRAFQKAQSRLINNNENVISINSREGS